MKTRSEFDPFRHVDPSRRAFLKKLLAGTFASPVIASFSTDTLSVGEAEAGRLFTSGNVTLDCVPASFYFETPQFMHLPHRLFRSDFQDTNAAGARIQVLARFTSSADLTRVAFTLQLSRRQPASALAIRLAEESGGGGVLEERVLAFHDVSGLSKASGVITQGADCVHLGPLLAAMAAGWARLEVQLPDGSLLRGAIIPIA
jgi:hypothetical protein